MDAGVSPTQTPYVYTYVLLSVDGYPWEASHRWAAAVGGVLPSANLPNATQVVVLMVVARRRRDTNKSCLPTITQRSRTL